MNALQIEIPSSDISLIDVRQKILNEVSGPQALRGSSLCRANNSMAIESQVSPLVKRPSLATAFLEDLRDAIVALDAQGRCVFVNRAFETMTGFGRAELIGSPLVQRIDGTQQASWASLARVFGTPSTASDSPQVGALHSQFRMHRADGSFFDLAVRWDRFPGSKSIPASFLLCKELMTIESELHSRVMELRVLRDELDELLNVTKIDENTAKTRWQAHTNQRNDAPGTGVVRSELSRREQEVLHSVLEGKRVATIAATLFLSENTVRNHLKRIYRKLGVGSLGELREHCSSF